MTYLIVGLLIVVFLVVRFAMAFGYELKQALKETLQILFVVGLIIAAVTCFVLGLKSFGVGL